MLALAKRAVLFDREARQGNWNIRYDSIATDLAGRKVLVLGFGRIGRRLVPRLKAMEMNVFVHDPYITQDTIVCAGATPVPDWRAVLPEMDFLSINCPKNDETDGMVGAKELASMKKTAFVINTARGNIVDEKALYTALKNKVIAGAGIDPFVIEPVTPNDPLFQLDNSLVSPHTAGIKFAIDYYGIDNVMYGSDYPCWEPAEALRLINEIELSEEDRHKLFVGNVRRIFGLPHMNGSAIVKEHKHVGSAAAE